MIHFLVLNSPATASQLGWECLTMIKVTDGTSAQEIPVKSAIQSLKKGEAGFYVVEGKNPFKLVVDHTAIGKEFLRPASVPAMGDARPFG